MNHMKRTIILTAACAVVVTTGCQTGTAPSAETRSAASPASHQTETAESAAPAPEEVRLPEGIKEPPAPFEGVGWESMWDGTTLRGWAETKFAGRGEAQCQQGVLLLNMGNPFTGLNYTNEFPKINYEIALDAMRVMGTDFFCGLTVPVGEGFCSLIVGGWGGALVGISSLDGMDASENETTKFKAFEQGRWYRIRLRVTQGRLQAWIDREKLIDVKTDGRKISLRPGEIEMSAPIGVACWQTTAALREIKFRRVEGPAEGR